MRPLVALALAACAHAAAPLANREPARPGGELRAIDWQNRVYELDELGPVAVKGGSAEFAISEDNKAVANGGGSGSFEVEPALFADLDGDGREEAVVSCVLSTGGTGHFSEVRVYGMRGGKPEVIGVIPGGDRGDGGIRHVGIEGATVIVDRNVLAEGDGLCCASAARRERWRWKANDFVEDEAARRAIQP